MKTTRWYNYSINPLTPWYHLILYTIWYLICKLLKPLTQQPTFNGAVIRHLCWKLHSKSCFHSTCQWGLGEQWSNYRNGQQQGDFDSRDDFQMSSDHILPISPCNKHPGTWTKQDFMLHATGLLFWVQTSHGEYPDMFKIPKTYNNSVPLIFFLKLYFLRGKKADVQWQ